MRTSQVEQRCSSLRSSASCRLRALWDAAGGISCARSTVGSLGVSTTCQRASAAKSAHVL